ncbi:MAG: 5'/3'-nucleotidase SurE, partial [Myxococcales bacterium]|nr:5'/3'-nucleotidase SurE [Myxococcales bacterium]
VLVTNDDGVHAAGIRALTACAEAVFDDVVVVAPLAEQSGVSQSLSLHRPLRVHRFPHGHAVDGTPVDAVFIALGHLCKDQRPDLVVSGINHGPNVGYDVYYSGTVGAAREALIHGIPSVAFSFSGREPLPFDQIAPVVRWVLQRVRERGLPPEVLLNVNIPVPRPDRVAGAWLGVPGLAGAEVTTLGHRTYGNEVVYREDPRGRPYYWIGGAYPQIAEVAGTDCEAVRTGYVSLTPLQLDVTAHGERGLDPLAAIFPELPR